VAASHLRIHCIYYYRTRTNAGLLPVLSRALGFGDSNADLLVLGADLAIVVTWLITGLNCLGIKKASDFQLVFTVLKVFLILVVVGLCFFSGAGHASNFMTTLPRGTSSYGGFMAALIATLWAYDGWSAPELSLSPAMPAT